MCPGELITDPKLLLGTSSSSPIIVGGIRDYLIERSSPSILIIIASPIPLNVVPIHTAYILEAFLS